ncbi:SMAD/FHA domain-containing protein [Xylariales sp. PMI_506]|nr:SMAD/FHA domain-containing protein [Xylariales sp. PMI_506]
MLPSIRFSAHYDPRSNRQSLSFTPVSRTLPTGKEVIKVGRYSEREQQVPVPVNTPSAAPVGFKSKVVSRRHCEFWHENGKWYIKDVKSSSGTFLNHIRLSPPGNESKPYIVNDGDIVQLGIDFRGGEEMIFRCVKMRIELNRGWQAKPNNFNVATHKRLRNMTSSASTASHAQDCSICLNAIAPCQSLFVAPCSHTWHYKCIRELLSGPSYPIFMCPNCRAAADLDAEIDEPEEDWQQLDSGMDDVSEEHPEEPNPPPAQEPAEPSVALMDAAEVVPTPAAPSAPSPVEAESGDVTMMLDGGPAEEEPTSTHAVSNPVPIATPRVNPAAPLAVRNLRTPSPNGHPNAAPNGHEGPLTPRNDAGPWVFDGDAGRSSQEVSRQAAMSSLDAAAAPV